MLNEDYYIISYHSNTDKGADYWNPPKNSAVQLAAAITASARIYMYPYISREDCYYTDTDSVVLGQRLPEDKIDSSVLGMFKVEARIAKGDPESLFLHHNREHRCNQVQGTSEKPGQARMVCVTVQGPISYN